MNNSTTLLSVHPLEGGRSSILIDAAYADVFYRFLIEKEFPAIEPKEAIYRTKRCYRDNSGKIIIESEPIDMEIIVNAQAPEIELILEEWIETIK